MNGSCYPLLLLKAHPLTNGVAVSRVLLLRRHQSHSIVLHISICKLPSTCPTNVRRQREKRNNPS